MFVFTSPPTQTALFLAEGARTKLNLRRASRGPPLLDGFAASKLRINKSAAIATSANARARRKLRFIFMEFPILGQSVCGVGTCFPCLSGFGFARLYERQ